MSPRSARVATANADEHGHHRVLGSTFSGNSQGENPAANARNPSEMEPAARIAETAALLASAFLRLSARLGGTSLISPTNSAACPVNSPESLTSRDAGDRQQQRKEIA